MELKGNFEKINLLAISEGKMLSYCKNALIFERLAEVKKLTVSKGDTRISQFIFYPWPISDIIGLTIKTNLVKTLK